MKIVAFLPAKGSSERIESKNLKLLNGKPLFFWTLEKLCDCDFIDEIYLDSETDEILNYASYLRYIPLKRDCSLATNKTDGHQLFYNEIKQVEADIYIQILGTSPFIQPDTIKRGIQILKEMDEYDSVVLVKKSKEYFWKNGEPEYDKFHIPNSCDLPDTIIESMGLYMVKKDVAFKNKMRYGDHIYLMNASALDSIDVNYPDEFELAECIMRGMIEKENAKLHFLANFFNSALFADIINDMGYNTVITGLKPNFADQKLFARANTLRLRTLKEGEDFSGIYDGLKTYERITPGEVIVVENPVGQRAYFGELNANLAIRAGAVGTIVSGVTRDIEAVSRLNYPVFSKGYCCADVKGYASVDVHQQPICIQGVTITPGDLIFADQCGVVCIPHKIEREVIQKAIEIKNKESNILKRIFNEQDAVEIYEQEGEF